MNTRTISPPASTASGTTGIRASVKQQFDAAVETEQTLKQQVSELKGSSLEEQDRLVQYNLLAREADTSRTVYEGLLQRYKELNAAAGISASAALTEGADVLAAQVAVNVAASLAQTERADVLAGAVGAVVAASSATTDGADVLADSR